MNWTKTLRWINYGFGAACYSLVLGAYLVDGAFLNFTFFAGTINFFVAAVLLQDD
jgi:hypothetical protein